jgi:hypothetical protein
MPGASNDDGRSLRAVGTDDSRDGGASDDENS